MKGSPAFLAGLGKDSAALKDLPQTTSKKMIDELSLGSSTHLYSAEELHSLFSPAEREAIETTKTRI